MKKTAAEVLQSVRRHYGAARDGLGPEWAVLPEFTLAPGAGIPRIDAFCVRAWRSGPKGHERHAIEIKVSRSDLRNELADPRKAAVFEAVSHRFFLATPAGLVKDTDPIPDHWGLLEVTPRGACRTVRKAARRDPDPVPDTAFVEAFRRAGRAETRIAAAAEDDPAAKVPDLERRLAAAQRAEQTAKAAASRSRQQLRDYLAAVVHAGGWRCVCGKAMSQMYGWRHDDATTECPSGEYGRPQLDTASLAERLGLRDPEILDLYR